MSNNVKTSTEIESGSEDALSQPTTPLPSEEASVQLSVDERSKEEMEMMEMMISRYQRFQEWNVREYGNPTGHGSNALAHSMMLFIASWVVLYAMNTIQNYYYMDAEFWKGSPRFGRRGAREFCENGESLLLAYPPTVSEQLAGDDGITNILIGNALRFAAILILASKLGNSSVFPIAAGNWRTIFNVLRMMAPAIALFFVPKVQTLGLNEFQTTGDEQIDTFHDVFAIMTFVLSPLFEIAASISDLIYFFRNKSMGDNYIPFHPSENGKGEKRRSIVSRIYKGLWVTLTILRIAVALLLIIHVVREFGDWLLRTQDVQTDACGTLRNIKTFILEKTLIGMIAAMYLLLSLSQMCESSGRRVSCLIYVVPLTIFALVSIGQNLYTYSLSVDIKENYLRVLNLNQSGEFEFYPPGETDLVGQCTTLLDLTTVPDNCFQLPTNPQ